MIADLRFIERDGKKILQMQKSINYIVGNIDPSKYMCIDWKDVPLVSEDDNDTPI